MGLGCATHRTGWRCRDSRGQALIEFALILPILSLFMVLAIDFGRAFFGWVGLQNAARIAANEAAWNPKAWTGSGDAAAQQAYRVMVMNDMQAINCTAPNGQAWSAALVPNPTFVNVGGTSDSTEVGDHAVVELHCAFTFITPIVSGLMGNPFMMGASAEFPIRGGLIGNTPGIGTAPTPTPVPAPTPTPAPSPSAAPQCVAPDLIGETVNNGYSIWQTSGFSGAYTIHRPPSSNYVIGAQTLVGGQRYPCSSGITVSRS